MMIFQDLWNYVQNEKVVIDLFFTFDLKTQRRLTPDKPNLSENALKKCKTITFPNTHGEISVFEASNNFWTIYEDSIETIEEQGTNLAVTGKNFTCVISKVK